MKNRYPSLLLIFQNCIDRGCTPEQLQDFLNRARRQHMDNPEMIRIIDDQETRLIPSQELPEGVEAV